MIRKSIDRNSNEGFALVLVLGFVFVVALFVTPFVLQARTTFFIAKNKLAASRLTFLADGLQDVIGARILQNALGGTVPLNGSAVRCSTPAHRIEISMQSHTGLIDINSASAVMLALGFQAIGYSDDQAASLAETVTYSRSIPSGTAQAFLKVRGGYRHRPYLSVSELSDIRISPALTNFASAKVFTVRTRTGQINRLTTPKELTSEIENASINNLPVANQAGANAGVYTIRIEVRSKRDSARGFSHRIVAIGPENRRKIRPLEIIPAAAQTVETGGTVSGTCDDIFGGQVTELLVRAQT